MKTTSREWEQHDSTMLTVGTPADPSEVWDDTVMTSHTGSMLSPTDYPKTSHALPNWDFEVQETGHT